MQCRSGILLTFKKRLNLVQEHIQAQYYFYVGILKAGINDVDQSFKSLIILT